jgi:hypothetical protein
VFGKDRPEILQRRLMKNQYRKDSQLAEARQIKFPVPEIFGNSRKRIARHPLFCNTYPYLFALRTVLDLKYKADDLLVTRFTEI